MARLSFPESNESFTQVEEIRGFLSAHNIDYECFEVSETFSSGDFSAKEILDAYKNEIEKQKAKNGYQAADLIDLSPETAGLDELLAKFSTEHTHSEDEVRFCIAGRGVFHINPLIAPVFAIEMEAGDLISVPAGTRHWFNLCQEKTIRVIRLFQDTTGWTPHYLNQGVEKKFEPLCLSQLNSATNKKQDTVVTP